MASGISSQIAVGAGMSRDSRVSTLISERGEVVAPSVRSMCF